MAHGNTSWHEFGQTYVNQSKKLEQDVTDQLLEKTERALVDAKKKIKETEEINEILKIRLQKAEREAKEAKDLLSKPMHEIAEKSGDFKKTFEEQQDLLANWILSQKAFRETAIQIGIEVGKKQEEIQKIVNDNIESVLENKTKNGNNAETSQVLKERADKILNLRKSRK